MPTARNRRSPLRTLTFACLLAGSLVASGPASATDEPAPEASKLGVSALGRIEPEHGILHVGAPSMVNAVNGAVLRKLYVETGQDVTEGQILAEVDTAVVEQAEVDLRKAELNLAERQAETAAGEEQDACSRAEVAQRSAVRRTNLRNKGVASIEEADIAAGDAKALSGTCSSARFATKAAAASVDVARAHVARAEAELDRCKIRAPIDGRVLRIIKRPGEMLGFDGVLEMGRVSRMYAIAEVYETDIRRVHVGQKATVTASALEAPLTGAVEHVRLKVRKQDATGTDPAASKDARIVEVEVLLDQPAAVAGLSNLQVEVLLHP